MGHKLSWFCAVGLLSACGCRLGGPYAPELLELIPRDLPGAPAPSLSTGQMQTLTHAVRRALVTTRVPRPARIAAQLTPPRARRQCRAHVTVRDRGVVLAQGTGRFLPLPQAFAEATRALLSDIAPHRASLKGRWERLAVECELTGPAEHVPFAGAGRLSFERYFETGIHGYGLLSGPRWWELRPAQVVSVGWGSLARPDLPVIAELLGIDARSGGAVDLARAYRFRSTHWWQPAADRPVVPLLRGLVPVPEEEVNPDALDEMIELVGDYLMDRQQAEGLFTYEYLIGPDEYSEKNNWVRQAGATWSLARYAAYTGFGDALEASRRANDVWIRSTTPLAGVVGAGFIDTDDGNNKLGVTALVLLALADGPRPEDYAAQRDLLVTAILSIQQDDGKLLPNFPPAEPTGSQYYYPGEALLALAREYQLTRKQQIADAFAKAHPYYVAFFEQDPRPPFVPWQVQAHALMHYLTHRQEYADFALRMSDWLARRQIDEGDTLWPDLIGGLACNRPGFATVSTASYLEGFAEALELARRVGDLERAEHYQRVVRSAARFVLQLIVKPEEAYFHTRPAQSLWGVRSFLTDTRLRIDHVQHALLALMKTRQALFGEPGPFRPVVSRNPPVNRRSPPPAPPLIPQAHRRARARD